MTRALLPLAGFLACLATGCGHYTLRGKVIDGAVSQVLVVEKDDPRLTHHGVSGALIQLTIDPQSLGRKAQPDHLAADDGTFTISVPEFGAGFLEYELGVVVRARGYDSAVRNMPLPGSGKRLLVMLAAGPDRYQPPGDLSREAEQLLRDNR